MNTGNLGNTINQIGSMPPIGQVVSSLPNSLSGLGSSITSLNFNGVPQQTIPTINNAIGTVQNSLRQIPSMGLSPQQVLQQPQIGQQGQQSQIGLQSQLGSPNLGIQSQQPTFQSVAPPGVQPVGPPISPNVLVPAPVITTGSSSQCLVLDASTICGPQFNGFSVLNTFQTLAAFSDSIRFAVNLDTKVNAVNLTGCNPTLSRDPLSLFRYQISFWCSFAVENAIKNNCSAPPGLPRPILCQAECDAAMYSVKNLYANETICPKTNQSPQAMQKRDELVNQVNEYCSAARTTQSNNNNQCIPGIQMEAVTCGFQDVNTALAGCQKLPNDPCCQNIQRNPGLITNPSMNPIVPTGPQQGVFPTMNNIQPGAQAPPGLNNQTTNHALKIQTLSLMKTLSTVSMLLGSVSVIMGVFA